MKDASQESCGDISRACKRYLDADSSEMLVEEERRKVRSVGGATACEGN